MNKWEKLRDLLNGWFEGAEASGANIDADIIESVLKKMDDLDKDQ